MFVHNFNHVLRWLPTPEDGHEAFMVHIADKEAVLTPATEFLTHMRRQQAESTAPTMTARLFMVAFAIVRFPIELLRTPEQPLEMTLLNKANALMGAVADVIQQDDANHASDVPEATALHFTAAAEEYHAAFAEWRRVDEERIRVTLQAAVAAASVALGDEEGGLVASEA
jgi:hypothetical protein